MLAEMGPPALFRSMALACFAGVGAALATTAEQSVSASRQFVVYGSDLALRGVICDLAERTKRELLGSIGQRDDWITPIVINARRPQANLPELARFNVDLSQTGFGLKLQLDVLIDPATNPADIRRELLRALILEMMYRREAQLPSGATYVSPPDWLLDGIRSDDPDFSPDRIAALLALSVGASGNIWPLHRFVAQRVELLDAAGRKLYGAYSCALVELLRRRPDGPRRLRQFILDLPRASNDPLEDLRSHFPEVFGTENAETTWQRQVARLAAVQAHPLLSSVETERRLAEILRLRVSNRGTEETYDLIQFRSFQKHPAAKNALIALSNNLAALAIHAHPLYAAVISEYRQLVSSIERGRTLRIPKRLEQLASTRKAMTTQMQQIDDYLNWFEATSMARPSGQFADYMKAAERAAHPERTKKDSISVYLDALEIQFEPE
jgi:hypothetical protein